MSTESHIPLETGEGRPFIPQDGGQGERSFEPAIGELPYMTPAELAKEGDKLVSHVTPVATPSTSALMHEPDFDYMRKVAAGEIVDTPHESTAETAEAWPTASALGAAATGAETFHDGTRRSHSQEQPRAAGANGPIIVGAGERVEYNGNITGARGTIDRTPAPSADTTKNIGLIDRGNTTINP